MAIMVRTFGLTAPPFPTNYGISTSQRYGSNRYLFVTKSAFEETSIDQKVMGGELITRAAPLRGLLSNGTGANPIISY